MPTSAWILQNVACVMGFNKILISIFLCKGLWHKYFFLEDKKRQLDQTFSTRIIH